MAGESPVPWTQRSVARLLMFCCAAPQRAAAPRAGNARGRRPPYRLPSAARPAGKPYRDVRRSYRVGCVIGFIKGGDSGSLLLNPKVRARLKSRAHACCFLASASCCGDDKAMPATRLDVFSLLSKPPPRTRRSSPPAASSSLSPAHSPWSPRPAPPRCATWLRWLRSDLVRSLPKHAAGLQLHCTLLNRAAAPRRSRRRGSPPAPAFHQPLTHRPPPAPPDRRLRCRACGARAAGSCGASTSRSCPWARTRPTCSTPSGTLRRAAAASRS